MSDVVTKVEGVKDVNAEDDVKIGKIKVLPNSFVLQVADEVIDENIEALRVLAK